MNLYLDVSRKGSIVLNFPELEPDQMKESCALDVADDGGANLEAVGRVINVTRERVRQIIEKAFKRMPFETFKRQYGEKVGGEYRLSGYDGSESLDAKLHLPLVDDDG